MIGAISSLNIGGEAGAAAIVASGADAIMASPEGAFALDQVCLKRCGFPTTGAPDDGLADLPATFKALFGLDGNGQAVGGAGEAAAEEKGVTGEDNANFSPRQASFSALAVLGAAIASYFFV